MSEHSFIIFKPDALERQLVESIIKRFISKGFSIEMIGYRIITADLIYEHYKEPMKRISELKGRVSRAYIGKAMIPIILKYNGTDAINVTRDIIGATDPVKALKGSIRGDLGLDSLEIAINEDRLCENLIHASDSYNSYVEELTLWFGDEISKQYI